MFLKTYERVVNTLLAGNTGNTQIVCRFRGGKLLRGTASKHRTHSGCIFRKFLRMKHARV